MSNFIPPIPLGQFAPSSETIASWLYQVWQYLQNNPIPDDSVIAADINEIVGQSVPPMIQTAIAGLNYAQFVDGSTLPVYRAANDEIDNIDLLEAWAEGCRFALVDDEAFYVMIKNGETISLLQVLTQAQATNVISVNGKTGVVTLNSDDIPNMSNASGTTLTAALNAIITTVNGIASDVDELTSSDIQNASNVAGENVTAALNALAAMRRVSDFIGQTLIGGTTITDTTGTTIINTYDQRKISDYLLLIFIAGASATDIRVTEIIPATLFSSGTVLHISGSHGVNLSTTSGVTINASTDTAIGFTLDGAKAFNYVTVVGYKLVTTP